MEVKYISFSRQVCLNNRMLCNDKVNIIHLPTRFCMQKKFLSNLLLTLGTNLLVKPVWILGIDRTFQNRLGLEAYGAYTNLFTFSLVLGLLLDFGINNYNSASLARNPRDLQKQFMPLLMIKAGLCLVYLLLTIGLGLWYGFRGEFIWLLGVLCINQCLTYASTFFRSTLSGLQLYRTDALVSSVDRLVMIVGGATVLMFAVFPISISTFVYLQTAGYLVAAGTSLVVLYPHLHQIRFSFRPEGVKAIFKNSLPFAVLALLMMLYTRLDVLLIKKLMPEGDVENGIYAQSTRLLDAVNMMAVLVSGLLLPMFSSMLKNRESITPLVKLAMLVLWVPAVTGVVFCYIYGADIMQLLYHETNPYHTAVFKLCITSVLPMCVMYIFGTLLTARGKLKVLIQTSLLALALNAMGNFWFIPRMGAGGAAIVGICTHGLVAVLNMVVVIRQLPVNISLMHLVKFLVLGIWCYGILSLLTGMGLSILPALTGYLLISGAIVLVLRIIDTETLKRALKRFQ
jgi:O-antigen/teichoic acid export membrane protein